MADSPLVDTPWTRTLDYDYPEMTTVDDDAWAPARQQALAAQRTRVEEIAASTEPATVHNVLHPLALSGAELDRLQRAFGVVAAADGTDQRQAVRAEAAPEIAAHTDWLRLHPGLFSRLGQLKDRIASGQVRASDEQQWFLQQLILTAEVAGAGLDQRRQERLKEINRQLAAEESAYSQLQVREAKESAVLFGSSLELAGLSETRIASARAAAEQAGHPEGYLLTLTMPAQQAVLGSLTDRETRRRLHTASVERGTLTGDDGRTTRQIGAGIAVLRAQKAQLLGHENYLESVLPLRTAPSRDAIESMLRQIAAGAAVRARDESERIAEHLGFAPESWDLTFGIEQVRRTLSEDSGGSDISLDEALHRLFDAARRVYGITVVERGDLPGYVPGARSFEVFDGEPGQRPRESGAGLGLFLLDLYTRPTKSGGAWMNGFSVPSSLVGSKAVVTNNLNVTAPAEGEAAVLTEREQRTLFHEFGHALHALLAEAEFPQLSGTAVPRDNVEFPSQVNEVFQELYQEPTPPGAAPSENQLWGKGASTVEHVAAVVIDLAWHTLTPDQAQEAASDPQAFEQQVLTDWGLDLPLVPPRYHGGFFKHIFASAGYAAGYYSYLWAEVLAEDAGEWFREVLTDDGALAARGAQFRTELLARGNTRDPLESFRDALGHDPDPKHLLRSLGLE
ncbi:M3 family metallopeptidase [Nesterenkonia muleiensis]|uniref:M3 family metallopeptidase n=1 Tax=Nesterenkonia muleiensis TaxID=2282648 RepID=UPI000E720807|nr:M3 family metallopeptidase [Nesterenkonia muleiensis]